MDKKGKNGQHPWILTTFRSLYVPKYLSRVFVNLIIFFLRMFQWPDYESSEDSGYDEAAETNASTIQYV